MGKIIIEGREFVPIKNGTFAHDIWLMQRVRAAGLASIQAEPGESEDRFIERVAAAAWESGAVLDLLAGSLIQADLKATDWTPELAREMAQFFGSVTDEESKKAIRAQIGGILFYFFITGLSYSRTSMKSGATTSLAGEPHGSGGSKTSGIGDS